MHGTWHSFSWGSGRRATVQLCEHRCADAATANGHAAIDLARDDCPRQRHNEVRIIVIRRRLVRAEIHNLVPGGANVGDQSLFQREPAVIRGNAMKRGQDSFVRSTLRAVPAKES